MILACSGCDGRYDVTGYPVGQQFRCRCGTINTLEAPSNQAALLACPHCGAGVAPTASSCAHCEHHLLVKGCPRCLSRVFHGHKHCPECGSELSVVATTEATAERTCPRCESALSPRLVADVVVDECMQCRGLFLDQVAVQRVITDRRQARAEALLGALPSSIASDRPEKTSGKLYIKCPICKVVMNRKLFGAGAGVIIDVCRAHGTFFDVGELPVIITYVEQGGLEKAEKKEIERMREAAKRDTFNAALANARSAGSSGEYNLHGGPIGHREFDRGSLLVDLLTSLFR